MTRPSRVSVNGQPSHKRYDLRSYIREQVRENMRWLKLREAIRKILEEK